MTEPAAERAARSGDDLPQMPAQGTAPALRQRQRAGGRSSALSCEANRSRRARRGAIERAWRWVRAIRRRSGLVAAGLLTPIVALIILSLLSARLVRSSALESAAQQAELLEEANNQYSRIVQRVEQANYPVNKTVPPTPGTVPLSIPATFLHDVGEQLSRTARQASRCASTAIIRFPGEPTAVRATISSARRSIDCEHSKGQETVHEFTEIDGEPVVRYAQARIMKHSCVECHNTHPLSTAQGLAGRRRARGAGDHPPAEERRRPDQGGLRGNASAEHCWPRASAPGRLARHLGKTAATADRQPLTSDDRIVRRVARDALL